MTNSKKSLISAIIAKYEHLMNNLSPDQRDFVIPFVMGQQIMDFNDIAENYVRDAETKKRVMKQLELMTDLYAGVFDND